MRPLLSAVEIAILALIAGPFVRLALDDRLRRHFPLIRQVLLGALALWLLSLFALGVYAPAWLHLLAALGVLGGTAALWRSRDDYGRKRGLPPGSLSLPESLEALVDRGFYLERAARHGPVFKMMQFHRPVVCIVGLEPSHRLLRDHHDVLELPPLPFNRNVRGGFLRYMDDTAHRRYAPLFRQALAPHVIEQARPVTTAAVRLELARASEATGAPAIQPDEAMDAIALVAFQRALFGLTPDSAEFRQIERALRPLDAHPSGKRLGRRQRVALDELRGILQGPAECARDLPPCVLRSLAEIEPGMPDGTCIDNLIIILKIAKGNVVGLMRWLLVMLATHPEWIERLRTELGTDKRTEALDLTQRIILETLRLAQSEYLFRRLRRDVELDGFVLPRGWLVRICVWESHRSDTRFEEPQRFDPDRFLGRTYPRTAYSPLGTGPHACNGAALTSLTCSTFIEELSRDYDWSVRDYEPVIHGFRHWDHWRPNRSLRLVLEPPVTISP